VILLKTGITQGVCWFAAEV